MDIIFNKFKIGYIIEYYSNVPNKKCMLVYDFIYQTIDKIPKDIVGLIMSYYKRQKIIFTRFDKDNYILSGNYVTIFLGVLYSKDELMNCNINVNEDIGIKCGSFRDHGYQIGNTIAYWYGHFNGYGETTHMNPWDYNNDREENVKTFLDKIKKFCTTLCDENFYHIKSETQIGKGYEIKQKIGKYINEWNNVERELDNYYFVSKYCYSDCVIELTKFEYECIVKELGEMRYIIDGLQI